MSNNKNTLPSWFEGTKYKNGETITNPFSGEQYELTAEQLSVYDFIMGTQIVIETMGTTVNNKIINDFHKGLDWFRETDAKGYMKLLD